jgi:uncharacterized protein (TIGR03067 family)
MRLVICTLVAVLTVALVGLDATADDAKDDIKALQGTWDLIYFERDGEEVKLQNDTKAINTGDWFVVKRGDQVIAAGTMKVDPSKKPKASEATYTEGPDKGKTFKGIYQFDGDTVKFCRAGSPNDERPTEFKTKPDSGQFVAVYKRAKQ